MLDSPLGSFDPSEEAIKANEWKNDSPVRTGLEKDREVKKL